MASGSERCHFNALLPGSMKGVGVWLTTRSFAADRPGPQLLVENPGCRGCSVMGAELKRSLSFATIVEFQVTVRKISEVISQRETRERSHRVGRLYGYASQVLLKGR